MVMGRLKTRWFLLTASLLLAIVAAPAWADFDSAVAAYERGEYQEAYDEFSALARDGDGRAQPYLTRIQRKLDAAPGTRSSNQSGSWGSREFAAQPSSVWNIGITPWKNSEEHSAPPATVKTVVPYHASVWSTLFHSPADATVIGLQYVAGLLDADRLYRELQVISRNGDTLTLGILAGVWWLLILRAIYGTGQILVGIVRTASTSWEHRTNG